MRPYDREEPKKIAWLQCVGSRDLNHCDNSYCSGVCCMYALKEAVVAKEHAHGDLETAIFFMDMRTYGKDFEKYYIRAKDQGVRFVRSRVHTVKPVGDGDLEIAYRGRRGPYAVRSLQPRGAFGWAGRWRAIGGTSPGGLASISTKTAS